ILFLDLDDFKTINDSLGHGEGDRLLAAVGSRLVGAVRSHDTVARFGGDEFAILLEELVSAEEALDVVNRVEESLHAPIRLRGREVIVTASLGLAHAAPGDAADDILRNADVAMYNSKETVSARHTLVASHARRARTSAVHPARRRHRTDRGHRPLGAEQCVQ